MLYNSTENLYMAVREPNPESGEIKTTLWSVWPTWESWTWPGYEGKELQVEVYSKYPKVQLYLNGKLIGEQATTEDQRFMATFNVPYTEGLLSAVGILDDEKVETFNLKTSGDASKVKLIADRQRIFADGQDLTFVTFDITDEDGNLQPNAENELHFTINGPGVIAGVDNANLKDTSQYIATTRKAWHGRALVIIRSTHQGGDIKLTVSSPGLNESIIIITSGTK
jgi:beta-galactosidase